MYPVIEMSKSGFLLYLGEILFTLPENKFVAIVSDGLEEFDTKNCINTNYKNIKPSIKGRGIDYLFLVNFDNFDKDIQNEICDAIFPTVTSRKDGKVFFIKTDDKPLSCLPCEPITGLPIVKCEFSTNNGKTKNRPY